MASNGWLSYKRKTKPVLSEIDYGLTQEDFCLGPLEIDVEIDEVV